MNLGFTGTQKGMTREQMEAFTKLIKELSPPQFHHGDCLGADFQANEMVKVQELYGNPISIHVHPPDVAYKRAFCTGFTVVYPEKPYLERNHDIVDATDTLVATPHGYAEIIRSGTWATIRYAKKMKKNVIIIYPKGLVHTIWGEEDGSDDRITLGFR